MAGSDSAAPLFLAGHSSTESTPTAIERARLGRLPRPQVRRGRETRGAYRPPIKGPQSHRDDGRTEKAEIPLNNDDVEIQIDLPYDDSEIRN